MHLNRQSEVPLYEQVKRHIEDKIKNGVWTPGTRLPSQRSLADSFHVNRSTIITALELLTSRGLIEGRRGGGTRVLNNTWGLMAGKKPTNWGTYVESGQYKPNLPMIQKINQAEFSPEVIRLGTGELSPDLLPYNRFSSLFASCNRLSLGYQEPEGDGHLREKLSGYLKRWGIDASPSSILIVSGALQALQLISTGLLDHGSTLLLEKPSYLYSIHVFQSSGMRFVGVPTDSEGIRAEQLGEIKRKYHGVILYAIPCYHNPTGTLMSEKRRQQILSICEQEQLPVIEDDVYRELWLDAPPPPPMKSIDQSGNVLYIGSFSKIFSAGMRIGWIIGPEPVINRLADIKMQIDYGSSSLSQYAAAKCLENGLYDEQASFIRKHLRARRDTLVELLDRYFSDLASWRVPSGGFYIWLKLIPPVNPRLLFDLALKRGVLLNPGVLYDRSAKQYLRLSYAYASPEEMKKAIHVLRDIIREISK
ncbi:PLP-dependent aminotransferase family protein [Sporolactobacillus sp. THM19-2]|uniref:aminotransferase-like domain-containing protein n=1 Tax=Sporolactobacillus sp. THM19-2 TaxID=2511171 RepID=UPI0010211751|nr:PLP-dependent aminotransferase family protein [Sporolactobacillus sp. THM19-2]RYL86853.1 PLP-dependent aminotransferase family protein [Sporolactobacillus sp. THM19-2]